MSFKDFKVSFKVLSATAGAFLNPSVTISFAFVTFALSIPCIPVGV
jgi:hypothetical protein